MVVYTIISLVALWVLGNTLSDQTAFSQWLEWIPTLLIIAGLVLSTITLGYLRSKISAVISLLLLVSICVWYAIGENKLFHSCETVGQLRFVGWTMSHPKYKIAAESAQEIIRLDADITLLTHGWYVRGEESIQNWLGSGGKKIINGPFTLLTKLKPIEVTTLVASGGIHISSFTLDASEQLGRPLVLWAIDFPSEFSKQRYRTSMIAKHLLLELDTPLPDLVAGDFNMTRDSASIKHLFPEMHDAGNEGGCGLIASYPRILPLYHIDHVLLNNSLRADTYKLIDPHVGRHRVQVCEISNVQ